jgi:alginate O-acetyltransferase complex protein AlgJ
VGPLEGDAKQAPNWMTDDWDGLASERFARDGKVIEGRDGFLFLANDVNRVLAQHAGELRLDPEQLERWRAALERRTEVAAHKGCAHLVMIIPNSHSVYPEKLPPGIESASERPVHQLMAHLEQAGSPVRLLYPLEEMIAGKTHHLVCSRTDSHWTDYGAFIAYQRLAPEVGRLVSTRVVTPDDVVFAPFELVGGLGRKFEPVRGSQQVFGRMRHREARLVYDNCVEGTGSLLATECAVAPKTSCLLLGDSYCYQLAKYLSESFRRLVFAHAPTLDPELLDAARPDLLVTAIAERFLITAPTEEPSPTLREREERKRARALVRRPAQGWVWPVSVSLAGVERMRAHLLSQGNIRDVALLSLLAYAGMRPNEALGLRWSSIGSRTIAVAKPRVPSARVTPRRVPLLRPVAQDLEAWRIESGSGDRDLVFSEPGKPWTLDWGNWQEWRTHSYVPLARVAGVEGMPPGSLGSVVCELLIDAGAPGAEVAAFTGFDAEKDEQTSPRLFDDGFAAACAFAEREIMAARDEQLREGAVAMGRPHLQWPGE